MSTEPDLLEEPEAVRRARLEEGLLPNLERRGFRGIYCATSAEAVETVRGLIPRGSLVGLGGSVTLQQCGLMEALRSMDLRLLDRYKDGASKAEVDEMRRQGLASDVYLASCNAIVEDGRLVNMDGTGNRVAAIGYGPGRVILVVGLNKLVGTLEAALRRIHTIAAPRNAARLGIPTLCATEGRCNPAKCAQPHRVCNQLSILEGCRETGRITVVLVGETLGY